MKAYFVISTDGINDVDILERFYSKELAQDYAREKGKLWWGDNCDDEQLASNGYVQNADYSYDRIVIREFEEPAMTLDQYRETQEYKDSLDELCDAF